MGGLFRRGHPTFLSQKLPVVFLPIGKATWLAEGFCVLVWKDYGHLSCLGDWITGRTCEVWGNTVFESLQGWKRLPMDLRPWPSHPWT